jgi:hypothetical protein
MTSIPWVLSLGMIVLSVLVWGGGFGWNFSELDAYGLFPLFGLLAFTMMWAHYAVDFLQRIFKFEPDRSYLPVTRAVVLVALLMHPGLLAFKQWQDGFGIAPLIWLKPFDLWLFFGLTAWLAFILFEWHRWFRERRWWRWVVRANAVAMILIVFHALNLGSNLQVGWFRTVWYFFGISLAIFLSKEYIDYRSKKSR